MHVFLEQHFNQQGYGHDSDLMPNHCILDDLFVSHGSCVRYARLGSQSIQRITYQGATVSSHACTT
jgi:hypothetical protein